MSGLVKIKWFIILTMIDCCSSDWTNELNRLLKFNCLNVQLLEAFNHL